MQDTPTQTGITRLRLDTRERKLFCAGVPVELGDRAFDILVFLAQHKDRLLTRAEIEAHVWAGAAVAPNNLTVQMSALRLALEKHGCAGLIQTVTGRGYRFIGDIEVDPFPIRLRPPEPPEPPSKYRRRLRLLLRAGAGLAVCGAAALFVWLIYGSQSAAAPLSIAVLPFRNLSDDRSQDYMADAITGDLTTDLSHIPKSIVIARESAEIVRSSQMLAPDIGRALRVRYLVEGSIRVEEKLVHINVQLIDARTGHHLWAERFDRPETSLAVARAGIVGRIAATLDVELTGIASSNALQTEDSDAISLFYRGRSIRQRGETIEDFNSAQTLLETAIRRQPLFGEAYGELGLTLVYKILRTDDPNADEDAERAQEVIRTALTINPRDATALVGLARLDQLHGDCAAASATAQLALDLEPDRIEAIALLAKCADKLGNLALADSQLEALIQLDPESKSTRSSRIELAQIRLLEGRYDDAVRLASEGVAGEPEPEPGSPDMSRAEYARIVLMAAYFLGGHKDEAEQVYRRYAAIWPNRSVWRIMDYASNAQTKLAGFKEFRKALTGAGMPAFSDEHATAGLPESGQMLPESEYAPVPLHAKGATTIDTQQLQGLLKEEPVVIADLGRGAAAIHGAHCVAELGDESNEEMIRRLLPPIRNSQHPVPFVVMADGPFGSDSYNGALYAVSLGYPRVYWYRGGEEAWAEAGLPSTDRRSP